MDYACAAILDDEPKERKVENMIEARVWKNGEWSFILVPVTSQAEIERKLKEAER